MNIKMMPGQFFIGIFIVIYFLYSFVAFRNRFEEKWRTVNLGDLRASVVAILGGNYKEQRYMQGDVFEINQSDEIENKAIQYLVWEVGVNNFYILGIDSENTVVVKARSEVSRLGTG